MKGLSSRFVMLLTAFGLLTAAAAGQSFYWNTVGARSQALGGVYAPSSTGVLDALSANPAGLTAISGRALDLSVTSIFARGSFTNSVNQNAPMVNSPGVIPYGAFGGQIGHSRFSFGGGIVPELTSVSDWRYMDAPAVAGASYGLQQHKSAILAARAVGGVGFALSKKVSVGATVGFVYNSNQYTAPYIFQQTPVLQGLKTLLDLRTNGWGRNYGVGILATPTSKLKFGLAWKSRTVIESTGTATGNVGAQLQALGLNAPADFAYSAGVRNVLPQSLLGSVYWNVGPRWLVAFQTNWVNWKDAFRALPVSLANGTNGAINGLVNSTSLADSIPLHWKDQVSFHGGFERSVKENLTLRGGYAHTNNPVPGSTLSPLTAAIMSNRLTTGFGYKLGRTQLDLAYGYDFKASARSQQSGLLSGEYSNSLVKVGTQSLSLNTSFRF